MSISPIAARSSAPAPARAADSGSSAGAAFGALVADAPAAVRSAGTTQARQPQQAQAATTATATATATAAADQVNQAATAPAAETLPVPELPTLAAGTDETLADPAAPGSGALAQGEVAADTLTGGIADDAIPVADPAQAAASAPAAPIQPPAPVQPAVAADAVVEQPATVAAVETPAPKPSTPKKQDGAAKADAKAQPAQATDASATPMPMPMPMAPAPQAAAASAIAEEQAQSGDEPLPSLSAALSHGAAKEQDAAADTSATAAKADGEVAAAAGVASGRDAVRTTDNHALAQGGLSSTLLAQSVPVDTKPASFGTVYAANLAHMGADNAHATVAAQTGRIGHDMGVEIARGMAAGRNEILVRLDPPEMGRIEVRMSFDRDGGLRAVVAADNQGALDLLKRDSADLVRALSDAGVRSDSQSFRFDTRSGDGGQQWRQAQQDGTSGRSAAAGATDGLAEDEPVYRQLRTSGRIDMMA